MNPNDRADEGVRILIGEFVTIYPRGKKRIWTADFHHGGRHHRRSLKTRNVKVARGRAVELERQIVEGSLGKPQAGPVIHDARLAPTVEEFLTYHETEDHARKTISRYRGILENLTRFATDQRVTRLSGVTLRFFDRYRAFRRTKVGENSMRHEGTLIKAFLSWCVERKLVLENPLASLRFTPPRMDPRGGPTAAQVEAILAACADVRFAVFATLAYTGMRSGECRQLRPQDVDLARNWIHIVSRVDAKTKTRTSRKVPIHPRLRPILEAVTPGDRWFFTALPSPRYPGGGHHINTKHLNEDFLKVLAKLDLPVGRDGGFTLHSLRHTFKTVAVNAGVPREVVDSWQGHVPDRRNASNAYYRLSDEDSQRFIRLVPFGSSTKAATSDPDYLENV